MPAARRILIMGAAGRDFHDFNVAFRGDPAVQVAAFTAAQIPNISGRRYPPALAGRLYPEGIPIRPEAELERLIREDSVQEVVFSYSDVSHAEVMHRASQAIALGADFRLLGPFATMLDSRRPVVSVCAVRTGCGKSQTARRLAEFLHAQGVKTVVVRHPMPYGDLEAQRCQRFSSLEDLDTQHCTIEEREEYEGHIRLGHVVYAGVDYGEILAAAEQEAEVILWDGGNNDLPFYRPDLHVVLADPHRAGHEIAYHPGEANLRMADVVLLAKSGSASPSALLRVQRNVSRVNPAARIVEADSVLQVDDPSRIAGRRVLVVEDGPTVTHGEMPHGAGYLAATRWGASEIVDPRPYALGSIREAYSRYPHLAAVLPAMGYGREQMAELKRTIEAVPCDLVLIGTPLDLGKLLDIGKPMLRVGYELDEASARVLEEEVATLLREAVCSPG